jgi:hypothetical protein
MRGINHAEDFGWSAAPRGGGGGGGSQTTYQQTILPGWVEQAGQQNYATAQDIAARPYQANPNATIVGMTPDQQQAIQQIRGLQGQADPTYNASIDATSGLLGNLQTLTPEQINANTAALMNPYTLATVAPTVAQMRESLGGQLGDIGSKAAMTGAFGGSRQGIEEGTAIGQEARGEGQLVGGLLSSGYQNAQQAAMDLAKQNLASGEWAATTAPQLATNQATLDATQAGLLGQVGAAEQAQSQNEANLQAQQWQDQWDYPMMNLALLESTLQNTPYGTTTIGRGPAAGGSNVAGNVIGGLGAAASIAGVAVAL